MSTRPSLVPEAGRQGGISLIELLVAMTVLAIATTIALMLYDGARRTFKTGENVAEQQQGVRIAFDMIASDLRMAGFNTNPDGNKVRPDEQIEAATPTAVVLRADFDALDPVAAADPEATLAGGAFLSVSTGNDEIVAYVLGKPDGSSPDTLTFEADVTPGTRDGVVEPVQVDGVDLAQASPPYTLYRVTFAVDGRPVRTPLIDNVRRLEFRYFDHSGAELDPGSGGESPADCDRRASIRRVRVSLEGLTRDPDATWFDAGDSDPVTRPYRKFRLTGDVTPRNVGMAGLKDFRADTLAPARPHDAPDVYPGHCDGLVVTWSPNPPADEVAYYRVKYTDAGGHADWLPAAGTWCYVGGLVPGADYTIAVQAVDAAGNQSTLSPPTSATTTHFLPSNAPAQTWNLSASTSLNGHVVLEWDPVEVNAGTTVGDPESPLIRDLAGYRVYRGAYSGFTPAPSNRIADAATVRPTTGPLFSDDTAVNCRPYYYRVVAVDRCGVEGAAATEVPGLAHSDVKPLAPASAAAYFVPTGGVRAMWDPVFADVTGEPIHIEDYKVFRTRVLPGSTDPRTLTAADFTLVGQVIGGLEFVDSSILVAPDQTVFYRVTATDDCSPANESDPSAPARPTCYFAGRPEILEPAYGSLVWGTTRITVQVDGGNGSYAGLRLRFINEDDQSETSFALPMSGTAAAFDWQAQPGVQGPDFFKEGPWQIIAEIDQLVGSGPAVCTATTATHVDVGQ